MADMLRRARTGEHVLEASRGHERAQSMRVLRARHECALSMRALHRPQARQARPLIVPETGVACRAGLESQETCRDVLHRSTLPG